MRYLLVLTTLAIFLCQPAFAQQKDAVLQFQIADQLKKSANTWNRGDLAGFMEDYYQSPELTFTSGGQILRGYEALAKRYEKSYGQNRDTMGRLSFSDVEVWKLAEGRALTIGRWKLERDNSGAVQKDEGVFTLIMVKDGPAWKIMHDHTSARK